MGGGDPLGTVFNDVWSYEMPLTIPTLTLSPTSCTPSTTAPYTCQSVLTALIPQTAIAPFSVVVKGSEGNIVTTSFNIIIALPGTIGGGGSGGGSGGGGDSGGGGVTSAVVGCGNSDTNRATGLVTTKVLDPYSIFGTSGPCIKDSLAAFVQFRIPTYANLKSIYYDQSKATNKISVDPPVGQTTQTGLLASLLSGTDKSILVNGGLTIDSTNNIFTGATTPIPVVVFVQNDLNIKSNILYAKDDKNAGLVFVVSGDVNIDKSVTEINAVIISTGQICTAYDFSATACPSTNVTSPQLTINGNLISLWVHDAATPTEDKKIKFRRTLTANDNSIDPAEKIQSEAKYLVIMRNVFASPIQKWMEIK